SPRWRAGPRPPSPSPCSSPTSAHAGANSPASGHSSALSDWGWGGRRSPSEWSAAWRAARTSRIFWSARPATSCRRAACSLPDSWRGSSGDHTGRRPRTISPAARPVRDGGDRPDDARPARTPHRADGVLATIACEKHGETPAGDHTVFLGIVTGGSVTDRTPLLYYRGGYASLSSG